MRTLYNPFKAIGNVLGGGGGDLKVVKAPTPRQDEAREDEAQREGARKARVAAAARSGQRRTLLSGPTPGGTSTLQTRRKTLLGTG